MKKILFITTLLNFIYACNNIEKKDNNTLITGDSGSNKTTYLDSLKKGKLLFDSACVSCHNSRSYIVGPPTDEIYKNISKSKVDSFTKSKFQYFNSHKKFLKGENDSFLYNHPNLKTFSENDLNKIIMYIQEIAYPMY